MVMNPMADIEKHLPDGFKQDEAAYRKMRADLLKVYADKWIGIHKGRVVASGTDLYAVTQEAFEKTGSHVYITKVGEEDLTVRIRRLEFPYDTTYSPFALPQAEVKFANIFRTCQTSYSDVIPDTGADISCLPVTECKKLDLFRAGGLRVRSERIGKRQRESILLPGYAEINGREYLAFIEPISEPEKLLGRDVLNRLTVTFNGREGRTIFEE